MKRKGVFIIPRDCRKEDDGALIVIKHRIEFFINKFFISKIFVLQDLPFDNFFVGLKHSRHLSLLKIINIFRYNIPPIVSFYFNKNVLSNISKYLEIENIDTVYIEHLHLSFYGKLLKKKYPYLKIVLFHHNIESNLYYSFYQNEKSILKKIFWYINFYLTFQYENKLSWIDENIFISKSDFQLFKKFNNNVFNIKYLEPFINIKKFNNLTLPSKKTKLIVGFIGSLDYYPNINGVLWFLENVYLKFFVGNDNFEFWIVGKNPPNKIQNFSKRFNNINVTGWVENDLLFFEKFDIFISPIFVGGGIKIKILNALAAKKCIIATSFSCVGIDGIKHNKNIIISDTNEDFYYNILSLYNDFDKIIRLSNESYNLAVQLSDKYLKSLDNI